MSKEGESNIIPFRNLPRRTPGRDLVVASLGQEPADVNKKRQYARRTTAAQRSRERKSQ